MSKTVCKALPFLLCLHWCAKHCLPADLALDELGPVVHHRPDHHDELQSRSPRTLEVRLHRHMQNTRAGILSLSSGETQNRIHEFVSLPVRGDRRAQPPRGHSSVIKAAHHGDRLGDGHALLRVGVVAKANLQTTSRCVSMNEMAMESSSDLLPPVPAAASCCFFLLLSCFPPTPPPLAPSRSRPRPYPPARLPAWAPAWIGRTAEATKRPAALTPCSRPVDTEPSSSQTTNQAALCTALLIEWLRNHTAAAEGLKDCPFGFF